MISLPSHLYTSTTTMTHPTASKIRSFKKPFQPTLTSYRPAASSSSTPSPHLPRAVQASLLHVGMRVRKAVHAGYQTDPKKPAQPQPQPRPTAQSASCTASHDRAPPRRPPPGLVPFCDVYDDGGSGGALEGRSLAGRDQLPRGFGSLATSPAPKRRWDGDGDGDGVATDGNPGVALSRPGQWRELRPIAQPKSRRKAPIASGDGACVKEVVMEDFGEADFLMPDVDDDGS
jgi:hypothetical protein